MRYIDAEKLKERVIRLIASARQNDWPIAEDYLRRVIDIIYSLQQEQPQVADASKMERLNVDILRDWSMRFAPDIREMIESTAYHFWNLAICSRKEK